MKTIIDQWIQSLFLFSPLKLKAFFFSSFKRFYAALKIVICRFGVLLAADIILLMLFGNIIFKTFSPTPPSAANGITLYSILVLLLIEVNWFIFSTIMLLFIRKKDIIEPLIYVKQTFFAYLQLTLAAYLFLFVATTMLVGFGISQFPAFPWYFVASHTLVKFLTIFYWLDSSMQIKDIFLSFERAVNCLVYNLPTILFFMAVLWGLDFGIKTFFLDTTKVVTTNSLILSTQIDQLIKALPVQPSLFKFLCLRYFIFLLKHLWASLVYVFYNQKKDIVYATSLIESFPNQQPPV